MSKLVNIQILRAVAAMSVVLYHVGMEKTHICEAAGRACEDHMWFGLDGVKLFFMISGFIMVVTSWNAFGKPGAAWDFMRRRLERIVPVYWLITTLAVVGIALVPSMLNVPVLDAGYIAASYLFYPVARVNGLIRPIANLGWTLELEMMFYVIFAAALFFSRKLGMILAMGTIVALTAGHVAGLYTSSIPFTFWGDPIILDFVLGMAVGAVYKGGATLPRWATLGLLVAFVGLAGLIVTITPWIDSFDERSLTARLVVALPAAALFLAGVFGPQLDATKRLTKWGLLLGDASYSLYLVHPFALRPLGKLWGKYLDGVLPMGLFTALAPFAAIASGLILYWLVEKPLTTYFAKRRAKQQAAPAFATTAAPR